MDSRPAFLTRHWDNPFNTEGWQQFNVGTVDGAWRCANGQYEILAITNANEGNGHVEYALAWFLDSCKRDKMNLVIRQVMNPGFAKKLVKLGFIYKTDNDLIYYYDKH